MVIMADVIKYILSGKNMDFHRFLGGESINESNLGKVRK